MRTRSKTAVEYLRGSLFLVPTLCVLGAVVLGQLGVFADAAIGGSLPELLSSTVDSARALLAAIATATLTVAFVTLSVTLLTIQLASSQFSPRALHGFFRDPVTKWVTGLALGTFAYCLVVLRGTRGPLEAGGEPSIPNLSALVALAFALASVVAVLIFIDHSARSMRVGEIIERITEEARRQIDRICPEPAEAGTQSPIQPRWPTASGLVVRSRRDGWVQQMDMRALVELLPPGTTARIDVWAGAFVAAGAPLCAIWSGSALSEDTVDKVGRTIQLGRERTTIQDLALGPRQLVDIALRALSPGINDPTTARESIVHLSSMLRALLGRKLPPSYQEGPEGRIVIRAHDFTHDDYVDLVFDEIRLAARGQPWVLITVLGELQALVAQMGGLGVRNGVDSMVRQARLTGEVAEATLVLHEDRARVKAIADHVAELGKTPEPPRSPSDEESLTADARG